MEPDKRLRQSLESYKNLAEDFANHETMLKDRTILSYVAYVMSMPKPELVELGMEILELFAGNGDNWLHLTSTFGVREALEAVSETHGQSELGLRAQLLRERIEGMKPPIHNLRSRCRRVIEPRRLKTHVIVLHVQGLLPVCTSL
ncbi:hypothetical protein KM043_016628 [Ampulex compressa]|nr:hypothetical protein KM043_016628 [Ampulex compressa]